MIINASAKNLPFGDNSFDAVVTDPPYGFKFMGKKWDYDVPAIELWEEVYRVMKPGAHMLAFGGSRTYHRAVCRIEDAGFEIRDCLMWIYGSGYPKSHNLHGEWEGWGTALKPAFEPVVLARKPLEGTVAENVAKWGCGALNIQACRIQGESTQRWTLKQMSSKGASGGAFANQHHTYAERETPHLTGSDAGRWPANIILDEEAGALLDEQSGELSSGTLVGHYNGGGGEGIYSKFGIAAKNFHANRGGASRFFYCAKASKAEREAGLDSLPERVKVFNGHNDESSQDMKPVEERFTTRARNHHPNVKPIALLRYLCRLITPPNGLILDTFCGSGSTGLAAEREGFRAICVDLVGEYTQIAHLRNEHEANRFPLFAPMRRP